MQLFGKTFSFFSHFGNGGLESRINWFALERKHTEDTILPKDELFGSGDEPDSCARDNRGRCRMVSRGDGDEHGSRLVYWLVLMTYRRLSLKRCPPRFDVTEETWGLVVERRIA